ncbi:hypothetical protein [Streptomyces venezuelae]|uniref:hypothetical protein n=1 Tax=Streptomyces venezuelae TaxID=54571 RepID=UPI001238F8FF|nr:hypothetical protein [Streptomyces venezuelae]
MQPRLPVSVPRATHTGLRGATLCAPEQCQSLPLGLLAQPLFLGGLVVTYEGVEAFQGGGVDGEEWVGAGWTVMHPEAARSAARSRGRRAATVPQPAPRGGLTAPWRPSDG